MSGAHSPFALGVQRLESNHVDLLALNHYISIVTMWVISESNTHGFELAGLSETQAVLSLRRDSAD
jgi:hypothetical protein